MHRRTQGGHGKDVHQALTSNALPEASDWKKSNVKSEPTVKLRNWLTFLRIHTSNLTQVGAMLGPLLAGVRNVPLLIIYAVWGLCYHAWGFTDNNIQDFEYDKKDPAKQHFALVKGVIPISKAKSVNIAFFIPTLLIGLLLGYSNPASIAFLFLSITSGVLYNRTCKKSLVAPLYITIAFTSIPLFTYFTVATDWNIAVTMVAFYTMFLMIFQIAFEGYLKDLQSDPVNLLRKWGARVEGGKLFLGTQIYFWPIVKTVNICIPIIFFALLRFSDYLIVFVYDGLVIGIFIMYALLVDINYDNKKVTANAARMEILTYFALIVSLQYVLGWEIAIILLVYPILWFTCLNYATWRTLLRPKV